jgi:hypothetical protein
LDHRWAAGVDSVDDLGVVDALEVDRGDAEVAVLDMRVIWSLSAETLWRVLIGAPSGAVGA